MKKLILSAAVIAAAVSVGAANNDWDIKQTADDVVSDFAKAYRDVTTKDDGKDWTHAADPIRKDMEKNIGRIFGGDAEAAKNVIRDLIDRPSPGKAFIDASKESTTASRDKDEVLEKDGNIRSDALIGRSVVPGNPHEVGTSEVRPNGPMITAAPEPAASAPASAPPAPPQHDHQGAFGGHDHGGGDHGWAGPDAHGGSVDHAGHIA